MKFVEMNTSLDKTPIGTAFTSYRGIAGTFMFFPANAAILSAESGLFPDVGGPTWFNKLPSQSFRDLREYHRRPDQHDHAWRERPWETEHLFPRSVHPRRRLLVEHPRLVGLGKFRLSSPWALSPNMMVLLSPSVTPAKLTVAWETD